MNFSHNNLLGTVITRVINNIRWKHIACVAVLSRCLNFVDIPSVIDIFMALGCKLGSSETQPPLLNLVPRGQLSTAFGTTQFK